MTLIQLISVLVLCLSGQGTNAESLTDKVKHVIVLMLENRSFDHMLGFLKTLNADINGCSPGQIGCDNHLDPLDTTSPTVTVDDTAVYVQVNPYHSIAWTTEQIYGLPKGTLPAADTEPTMDGFIAAYADTAEFSGDVESGSGIMKCFSPEHIPIMSNLSMEYALFDGWFASVPGPTMVNRAYAASGTSHGMGTNDVETIVRGLPQQTMFNQLLKMGLDYRVYFKDAPSVVQHKDMRRKEARQKFHLFDKFYSDLDAGNLPEFTWLEPGYFSSPIQQASDQHPDHDVGQGEQLIKEVYEAVRASSIWENTLLVITYDEHGGFFDHVHPPFENVPNPDGLNATDDPFDFTRLGVRVPSLLISPWIKKGTVIHAEPNGESQYDHSSIINTVVHKLFKENKGHSAPTYLNKRDEWAKSFEWVVDTETVIRTDCPMTLPPVYLQQQLLQQISASSASASAGAAAAAGNSSSSGFANRALAAFPPQDGSLKLSELQKELVVMIAGVTDDEKYNRGDISLVSVAGWTEHEGFDYVRHRMELYLNSDVVEA